MKMCFIKANKLMLKHVCLVVATFVLGIYELLS